MRKCLEYKRIKYEDYDIRHIMHIKEGDEHRMLVAKSLSSLIRLWGITQEEISWLDCNSWEVHVSLV